MMQTEFLIDLKPLTGAVLVEATAEEPLDPELTQFIEANVRNAALLVSSQALSPAGREARMDVARLDVTPDSQSFSCELDCDTVPPSTWRVLAGLLSAFDMASATLTALSFKHQGHERAMCSEREVLGVPYPERVAEPGFPVSLSRNRGHRASLEIEVSDTLAKAVRAEIASALNAWLRTCQGGFFADGKLPVTAAHDLPRMKDVAASLLVARFDIWTVNDKAFDAVVNMLSHFHRKHDGIRGVKVY
ncbi:Hypothetical protein A7982_08074 [Minicystis rosea]|nr:Hypothetical protein A7982_08074 [Minicystis rosea]